MSAEPEPIGEEEYVEQCGLYCPFCGSSDIVGGSFDIEATSATQEVSCNACHAEWTDDYKLVGYTVRSDPEEVPK